MQQTKVTVDDILDAQDELVSLQFTFSRDLYAYTWQASHVRFVELETMAEIGDAVLAAYVLNDSWEYRTRPEVWLPNARIEAVDQDTLSKFIQYAFSDIAERLAYDDNTPEEIQELKEMESALDKIVVANVTQIKQISLMPDRIGRPHKHAFPYGPTYQLFWRSNGHFFFLEVHNES